MVEPGVGKPVQLNTRISEGLRATLDFAAQVDERSGEPAASLSSTVTVALDEHITTRLQAHRAEALAMAPLIGMTARAKGPDAVRSLSAMQHQLTQMGFADVAEAMNVDMVAPPAPGQNLSR